MSETPPDVRLLETIRNARAQFNQFPQGSDLAFEKLMNPEFTQNTNKLKAQLIAIIRGLYPDLVIAPGVSLENVLQQVARYSDGLIQKAVCSLSVYVTHSHLY